MVSCKPYIYVWWLFPVKNCKSWWSKMTLKDRQQLPSNTHSSQWPKQDHIHMPLRNVRLPTNVIQAMQCTRIVPNVHDVHFLGYDWGNYGSFHGRFLGLWNDFWSLSRKFGQSLAEMLRKGSNPRLGEMPFHGRWRHHLRTLDVRERDRGGQGENWSHWVTCASLHCERNPKLPWPCRILPAVHRKFLPDR